MPKVSFSFDQISEIIRRHETFKPQLLRIMPKTQPIEVIQYLMSLASKQDFREQCLVNYQDHWIGLDLQRESSEDPISIVVLDAAISIKHIAGFCTLIEQICEAYQIPIQFIHIGTTTAPLQRDGYGCAVFAYELLQWAKAKENLHQELQELVCPEDYELHWNQYRNLITSFKEFSPSVKQALIQKMSSSQWVDYKRLKANPAQWGGFFVNTQTLPLPDFLESDLNQWLIEESVQGRWVLHNIRIHYCKHQMEALLEQRSPLSEEDFIIQYICKLHNKNSSELGQALRTAVHCAAIEQVRKLLTFTAVNINEVPLSRKTALDRAYDLPEGDLKREMIQLLESKGAQRACIGGFLNTIPRVAEVDNATPVFKTTL